ncbi:hypothetical protein DU52_15840 [Methanosarcina mazei]|uniref:Homeodomain phBC6A51-type domain-containing protein n=1 Tax=Methanosarcina mazei TaxID=2209 RepID=A0A0F8GSN8_METMZ|nr:hypothetical protein [Methanosarcina mazei]KKG35395.1 hypothetical protein DU52_15840 [Methanosarcina mazei]
MAVQKKKEKKPINPNVFKWTPQRKKAALLLSVGTKTNEEVAAETRIHFTTLYEWKKSPVFLAEVDRLTLENELATRAGLVRFALKAIEKKKDNLREDKNTALDWAKFLSDIQGHTKQKVELEGNLNHSGGVTIYIPDNNRGKQE